MSPRVALISGVSLLALALGVVFSAEEVMPVHPLPAARGKPLLADSPGMAREAGQGLLLRQARPGDLLLASRLAAGDGGGGDVSNVAAFQILFLDSLCTEPDCEGPCNVALLVWTENTLNPDGVDIFANEQFLGTVPGLDQVPGTNAVQLLGIPAGFFTFRVQDVAGGSFGEADLEVLDNQPFPDPQGLACRAGNAEPGGTCEVLVTWTNSDPLPELYAVFFDGIFLGEIDGTLLEVTITGVPPGAHCVTLAGSSGPYGGCFVEACCDVNCGLRDCNQNGVHDAQDIAAGTSQDCDLNGVPDECEAAVSHGAAMDAFLNFIAGDPNAEKINAFLGPCFLSQGDVLGPYHGDENFTLDRSAWFIFVDDHPGAHFVHPVRYVLVDAFTGEISVTPQDFYPAVNGVPLYGDNAGNFTSPDLFFGGALLMPPMGPGFVAAAPAQEKKPTVWGVVVGGTDPADKAHADRMTRVLKTNPGIDCKNIVTKKCASKKDLCDALDAVKGCDKVFFVLTTHGSDVDQNGVKPWSIDLMDGWLPMKDLVNKLKATGAKKFCIAAETCHSGCLIELARGQIDADIATACSKTKKSIGWPLWIDSNNDGNKDPGETITAWHYLQAFATCLTDANKDADKKANGGDGDGKVGWMEAHAWAKKVIEAGRDEKTQDPQYETTFSFDAFLWSGGTGVSGGQGCTKLDLYNPSCTETREVDWEISLPGPNGLKESDGVGITTKKGTTKLKPKEKTTIKITFTFPALPDGGIIFPKATVKIAGTEKVLACVTGCVMVPVATQPKIDQKSHSSFIKPSRTQDATGRVQFGVSVEPQLLFQPLTFQARAQNVNPEDERTFMVNPPFLTIFLNSPTQIQEVNLNIIVPAGTPEGTVNEIFLEHVGGGGGGIGPPGNFATLGAFARPATTAGDCNENGISDAEDVTGGASQDCDLNGVPDECQPDCDLSGTPDECDIADGRAFDANADGIPDGCQDCQGNGAPDPSDIESGRSRDCDEDGMPDECQDDCNASGLPDLCDLATGASADCDHNNTPDECDIGAGALDSDGDGVPDECQDCNANGSLDPRDIANGVSSDCNGDGVPDECDLGINDCNANGIPDDCDLAGGSSTDCDGNTYPDECELLENDCNLNGRMDSCDIAAGSSADANLNAFPDECEPVSPEPRFVRGDANAQGMINITSGIYILAYLFAGGPAPPCRDAADANDQGSINISSAIFMLNWLFLGGLPPRPPAPSTANYAKPGDCGLDPTPDALDCVSFPPCT